MLRASRPLPARATRPPRSRDARVSPAGRLEWPACPAGPPALRAPLPPFPNSSPTLPHTLNSRLQAVRPRLPLLRSLAEPLDCSHFLGDPGPPPRRPSSDPARGSHGHAEARGQRTWPQAERPGHQEAPGQVHGVRRGGGGRVRGGGAASPSGSLLAGAPSLHCAPRARLPDSRRSCGGSGRARAAGRGARIRSRRAPGQSQPFCHLGPRRPAPGRRPRTPSPAPPLHLCRGELVRRPPPRSATKFHVAAGRVAYIPISQREELHKAPRGYLR